MIRSGSALRTLVALGVTMLLIAWAIRRLLLPDASSADDPVGPIEAHCRRHSVPADLLALRRLGPPCREGRAAACTELGRQIGGLRLEFPELAPPPCVERPLFERACADDDMEGCTELAHVLREGRCGGPDPQRAQDLYARACAARVALACEWVDSEAG